MALTDEEREQVVELLRCAADNCRRSALPFSSAVSTIVPTSRIEERAYRALRSVYNEALADGTHRIPGTDQVSVFTTLLEAAQRVEEGSWP